MAEPLKQALDNLGQAIQRRESAKVYQLALWADPQRGIPNEFARSALFAAVAPNKTTYLERQTVFSQKDFKVTFTGKRLTQSDLDVFEGVAHIARGTHEGNRICFRAGALLRLIGRATGKSQYQWLLTVLNRLTATCVGIERNATEVYGGSLLPNFAANLETGEFSVEINRQLIKLFDRGFTVIQWEQRRQLQKKPLAQALHLWILSHENRPYPVTVAYLRDLTGSQTKELRRFRANLKVGLNELQRVGAIVSWVIDSTDKLSITVT